MTNTYTASGVLTNPVNNLHAARIYLRSEDIGGMTQFAQGDDRCPADAIHDVSWDLLDEGSWKVTVITNRLLTDEESASVSDWISGQNSDGLGEGFEQQPFAEEETGEDYEDITMSSFDWMTNKCELTLVK